MALFEWWASSKALHPLARLVSIMKLRNLLQKSPHITTKETHPNAAQARNPIPENLHVHLQIGDHDHAIPLAQDF